MQAEAAEEEEADNSTPQKLSETPEEEVFETIYGNFQVLPTWQARARCCRSASVFLPNTMILS